MSASMEAAVARLEVMVANIADDVIEIRKQTTETNGRVRRLEAWRAGVDAVGKQHAAMWAAVGLFASTVGGGVAVALLT